MMFGFVLMQLLHGTSDRGDDDVPTMTRDKNAPLCLICLDPVSPEETETENENENENENEKVCLRKHVVHDVCRRRWYAQCRANGNVPHCPACRRVARGDIVDIVDNVGVDRAQTWSWTQIFPGVVWDGLAAMAHDRVLGWTRQRKQTTTTTNNKKTT